MIKHNYFVKFQKKIYLLINNLLKKNLNNLNSKNLSNIVRSNKFFLTIVALIILFFTYLLIPNIHDKNKIQSELKDQLLNKFNLNFSLSQNIQYDFFPRPHFVIKDSIISDNQGEVSNIKELKIYVSLNNLFSLRNIKLNSLVINDANFNLNNKNYYFFIDLLSQDFKEGSLIIKNSNIFYKNKENEVLLINKIINMKYQYDIKNLRSIVFSKNEIFNLPYSLELYDNKIENKIFSKLNFDFLKLQIENEIDYTEDIKKGFTNLIINKSKSNIEYEFNKNLFIFNFFSKLDSQDFLYKGEVNFNPFYSGIKGRTKKISLNSLLNSNTLVAQIIKSEILNNKNLDFYLNIISNKIKNFENFENIFLNFKIQEGLIDFDNSKFSWKNYADFLISDSLLFVKNNELVLDAQLDIKINNSGEIYKFLLTPKNYRTKIQNIELSFKYNFDQKILDLNDIKVDNKINSNLNDKLKRLIFKNDKLQNKIYFKNILNKSIKSYAG